MSDNDEIEKIRQRKREQLEQQQQAYMQQQELQKQQQELFEQQKNAILGIILSPEAHYRLQNIKMVKSDLAESIEIQLIQLYQQGTLNQSFKLPMSDSDFKVILERIQSKNKRDTKIKIM